RTRLNARGTARHRAMLLAAPLVLLLLGSDAPKEYDGATESGSLEGTWQLVALEINGAPAGTFDQGFGLTFRGRTYRSRGAGGGRPGPYSLDPVGKPPPLDRRPPPGPSAGQTRKNIYQLEGDTLRLGSVSAVGDRPRSFREEGIRVFVLKRVKG